MEGVVGLEKGKCPVLGRKVCLSTVPCAVTLTSASWLFSSPLETQEGCRGLQPAHCFPLQPSKRRFFLLQGFPGRAGHCDGKGYFPSPARASREVSWGPHSKDPLGFLWAKPTVASPSPGHLSLPSHQHPASVLCPNQHGGLRLGVQLQLLLRTNRASPRFRLSGLGEGYVLALPSLRVREDTLVFSCPAFFSL